jgi:hypothetical protein
MTEQSEGIAYWCLDSGVANVPSLTLRGANGSALPLHAVSITESTIVVVPAGPLGKPAADIFVEAYVRRMISSPAGATASYSPRHLTRFHLRTICDLDATVVAQVHAQRPQYVAASYSCFYF